MIVSRDFRRGKPDITIAMSLADFREHVEWLESLDREDGCTREMRTWLDLVDPGLQDGEQ